MEKKEISGYTQIIVETDEVNPVTIAIIKNNEFEIANGYRIRLTPTCD